MDFRNKAMKVGIQRLYYVLWAVWLAGWVAVFIHDGPQLELLAICVLIGGVAPFVLLHAVRWIYAGFVPANENR